jgi:hypothetical protein
LSLASHLASRAFVSRHILISGSVFLPSRHGAITQKSFISCTFQQCGEFQILPFRTTMSNSGVWDDVPSYDLDQDVLESYLRRVFNLPGSWYFYTEVDFSSVAVARLGQW